VALHAWNYAERSTANRAENSASTGIAPHNAQLRIIGAVLGDSRLAVADVNSVPAGKYGKAALESLGM
jgi:ABC-type molybdate transport system substrate-binding protein